MHEFSPSLRFRIAILIFVFGCLLSTVRVLTLAPRPGRFRDEVAQRSDQRFAALKAALPPQGVVGYMGESGGTADYYLAQYALAPLVIDHSANHPLVVGNFPFSPAPGPPDHLQLLKDFGNGVLLFANKDPK
jgi:hypothetical protein